MSLGSVQQYLVKYNSYVLPGYTQTESFPSELNIAAHYGSYIDGSLSEDTGLSNKGLSLSLKVWECDYATVKEQIQLAATELRSKRGGFAPLYVMYPDRHYDAMVKAIKYSKAVPSSVRTGDYSVDFECRPWLIGESLKSVTGTGVINTDQVTRTIADGGWTPTIASISGTNVTISGYTANGDFTGFISVNGTVSNLVVDSEKFTATEAGVNANAKMLSTDYRLWVGTEKTYFSVTGVTATLNFYNRWNL